MSKSSPDAFASPTPGMRSIFDRMTNPTPQDLQVNDRLKALSHVEIDRMVHRFGEFLDHLAKQRNDLSVNTTRDAKGWTIRVDLV